MSERLHIVCLDAPSPPDYGGAIDMHYKIKALAATGTKISLHYFHYHTNRDVRGLEEFCASVYAYPRKKIHQALPITNPFIVQSRVNQEMVKRLNADEAPILLEGLHCAGIIPLLHKPQRIVVRMHNEEAAYYRHLAQSETSFFKRKYFEQESRLLSQFQLRMNKDIKLACLSESDIKTFQETFGFRHVYFIPCFIPWQEVSSEEGLGRFCLYHGNLSVSENEDAALWLIQHVFSKVNLPFTIAGKGISKRLASAAAPFKHIRVIDQPAMAEIEQLVRNAHIHVLPSMNSTGVKLKLLNALLNGRFVITNESGVMGSKITSGLKIADAPADWINYLQETMSKPFNQKEMQARKEVLALYNNQKNALLLNALW